MKTKHAILFGLSNKIVQISFLDSNGDFLNSDEMFSSYFSSFFIISILLPILTLSISLLLLLFSLLILLLS